MSEPRSDQRVPDLLHRATELMVPLVVVAALVYWCFSIFRPFLMPLVWGVVLAVALRPAYVWVEGVLGGRKKLTAILLVVLCLGIIIAPIIALSGSLLDGIRAISSQLEDEQIKIPPAPERVAQWPLVGPTVYETWNLASTSLETVLHQFRPQVRAFCEWLVALARQATLTVLLTAVAIVVAVLLLARREAAARFALDVGARIAGDRGAEAVRLAGETIGTVAKGVVGVEAIQSALAAAGLAVAGVPGAGLWALLVLVLAVAQLPPILVLGPAILYLVATDASMVTTVLFTVWSLVVSFSDALLKPLLLGRGSDTPMPVILIGAIGGLMLHGLIGLFVGAVVLSTGYRLFGQWMEQNVSSAASGPRQDA